MNKQKTHKTDLVPEIKRGRLEKLTIYDVAENELELLAQGAPNSIFLNFSIFLLSIGLSAIFTLQTTSIASDRLALFLMVVAFCGIVIGALLMFIWYKGRKSISELMKTIKNRVPPEGIPEIPFNQGTLLSPSGSHERTTRPRIKK
jgi:NADH:ubiquinone oxidoreductase subunit K